MAAIGEIRKRSGLLVVVIGIALAAFILGDLFNFNGGGEITDAVFIEDEPYTQEQSLLLSELESYYNALNEYDAVNAGRDITLADQRVSNKRAFNDFAVISMIQVQNNDIELTTPEEELKSLFFEGDSAIIHRAVREQPFLDYWPNRNDQNAQFVPYSYEYGRQLFNDDFMRYKVSMYRLKEKYEALVRAGFYATSIEGQRDLTKTSVNKNIRFVYKPYSSLNDADYMPTDEEIKAYYKKNKSKPKYRDAEGKLIQVLDITMIPSEEDKKVAMNAIGVFKDRFADAKRELPFIAQKSDDYYDGKPVVSQVDTGMIPEQFDSLVFRLDSTGVFGPYEENGYYKLMKIEKHYPRRARHILIKSDGPNANRAGQIIDSLYTAINADTSLFPQLAFKYGEDGTKLQGGDLGWFDFKTMVPAFADFVFNAEVGEIGAVQTQFGLHIVQVTGEKTDSTSFYTAAYFEKKINPLQETIRNYKDSAELVRDHAIEIADFDSAATTSGFSVREIRFNDNSVVVPGFTNEQRVYTFVREGIVDEYSETMVVDNRMLVFRIAKIYDKGPKDEEDAWEAIKTDLIKEKKAEAMKVLAAGKNQLSAVAKEWGVGIKDDKVAFADQRIDGAQGNDPYVVGAIFGNYPDGTTIPEILEGSEGVYMIQILSTENAEAGDYSVNQSNLQVRYRNLLNGRGLESGVYKALKDYVKVEDKRN